MSATVHLLITLAVCIAAVPWLARARWVWRSPRTGILLWQLLGLTTVLCVVIVAGELSPVAGVGVTATLAAALAVSWLATARTRRRHRHVLALVAREDDAAPGALVLDHPVTVAYCLPGRHSRVVLSSGALDTLRGDEVAAVLAHELAHAQERHDLVLLPFTALRRLLPASRLVKKATAAVALLVEMRADENAAPRPLAAALHRFTARTPPGTLGIRDVRDAAVAARLLRLASTPAPLPPVVCWLAVGAGLVLVSTPLSFLVW